MTTDITTTPLPMADIEDDLWREHTANIWRMALDIFDAEVSKQRAARVQDGKQ